MYTDNNTSMDAPMKPKKSKKKWIKVAACTCVFCLAIGGAYVGAEHFLGNNSSNTNTEESKPENTTTLVTTGSVKGTSVTDVSDLVEEVMPSIVSITCTETVTNGYFGQSYEATGAGSGIIIGQNSSEVLIATNNHVVADSTSVSVEFVDGKSVSAKIKGTDSSNDLAVVSVSLSDLESDTKEQIKIATLGDSEELKAGEMVVAIGNALGYGQSVTVGYVSALNREVQTDDYTMSLIQTDAAINPGNSGGALLNASGHVIGINSVKYASSEVEGMGYAIPISDAVPIINDLMNRESVSENEQGYLGIRGQDVDSSVASRFNMPEGIYVSQIVTGSPAEQGGLKTEDIIVALNGKEIKTMDALQEVLTQTKAGSKVSVTVKRISGGSYKEVKLTITLGSKSDSNTNQSQQQFPQ